MKINNRDAMEVLQWGGCRLVDECQNNKCYWKQRDWYGINRMCSFSVSVDCPAGTEEREKSLGNVAEDGYDWEDPEMIFSQGMNYAAVYCFDYKGSPKSIEEKRARNEKTSKPWDIRSKELWGPVHRRSGGMLRVLNHPEYPDPELYPEDMTVEEWASRVSEEALGEFVEFVQTMPDNFKDNWPPVNGSGWASRFADWLAYQGSVRAQEKK